MRSIILYIGLAILAFMVGAFIAGSWDISKWNPGGRCWLGLGFIAAIIVHQIITYLDPIAVEREMDKENKQRTSKWQQRMEELKKQQVERMKRNN